MNVDELAEKMFSLAYAAYMERGNEMKATLEIEALLTEAFRKQEDEFYFQRRIEFEASLKEVVAQEREECAKVCEDWNCGSNVTKKVNLTLVAAQIRRRGEGK